MSLPDQERVRRDLLSVACAALVVCLLLQQESYHPVDSHRLLIAAERLELAYPYHFGYLPLLALACAVGRALGASAHTAGVWTSAVATACGIFLLHLAWLRAGIARPLASTLALATLATPAVLYFGTTVEVHAVHFALTAFVLHAILLVAEHRSARSAVLLGVTTWIGYVGHATGALVPLWALPLAFGLARERGAAPREGAKVLLVAGSVHAALVAATPLVLAAITPAIDSGAAVGFLRAQFAKFDLADSGLWIRTAVHDGLFALMPLLPIALLLAFRRERVLAATLPSVLLLLGVTGVLLGGASENGAYLLPLVGPLGLGVARAVPSVRLLAPWIVIASGLATASIVAADTDDFSGLARDRDLALANRSVFLLVGSHDEVAAMLSHRWSGTWDLPSRLWTLSAAETEAVLPGLDAWFRHNAASGVEIVVTDGAVAMLRDQDGEPRLPAGPVLLSHFERNYTWQRCDRGAFRAAVLAPR